MPSIAVCVALTLEIKPLCQALDLPIPNAGEPIVMKKGKGECIAVGVSGVGRRRMEELIQHFNPHEEYTWLSVGLAGALLPRHKVGDCLIGNKVVAADGEELESYSPSFLKETEIERRLACNNEVVQGRKDRAELQEKTRADLADMESEAVVRHAMRRREPFAWIKVVSDEVDDYLPKALTQCVDKNGHASTLAGVKLLIQNPLLLPAMARMGYRSHKTPKRLAEALLPLLKQV